MLSCCRLMWYFALCEAKPLWESNKQIWMVWVSGYQEIPSRTRRILDGLPNLHHSWFEVLLKTFPELPVVVGGFPSQNWAGCEISSMTDLRSDTAIELQSLTLVFWLRSNESMLGIQMTPYFGCLSMVSFRFSGSQAFGLQMFPKESFGFGFQDQNHWIGLVWTWFCFQHRH